MSANVDFMEQINKGFTLKYCKINFGKKVTMKTGLLPEEKRTNIEKTQGCGQKTERGRGKSNNIINTHPDKMKLTNKTFFSFIYGVFYFASIFHNTITFTRMQNTRTHTLANLHIYILSST